MNDRPTPRTDAEEIKDDPKGYGPSYAGLVAADFARTLERELAEALETIQLQHVLMKSAERRGAEKSALELAAVAAERDRLRAALEQLLNHYTTLVINARTLLK